MYTYERVKAEVEKRSCCLKTSDEEYKLLTNPLKSNINIISQCGHETRVQLNNLLYSGTGIRCKQCCYKEERPFIDCSLQEHTAITRIRELCNKTFEIKRCCEGCLADFAIRPHGLVEDVWMPIQMKSTQHASHVKYIFHWSSTYSSLVAILFVLIEEKMWVLEGVSLDVKNISIGIGKSIYDKYKVDKNDICTILMKMYLQSSLVKTWKDINTPLTLFMQREQEFHRYRETTFPDFTYEFPEVDGRVYDVIINGYKVQDKVIGSMYQAKTSGKGLREEPIHYCNVYRHSRKGNKQYLLGDNDYYWLHLPNKDGADGAVIPEKALYELGLIAMNEATRGKAGQATFYPYKANTECYKLGSLNEHLYFYNDNQAMVKLRSLFVPSQNKNNNVLSNPTPSLTSQDYVVGPQSSPSSPLGDKPAVALG